MSLFKPKANNKIEYSNADSLYVDVIPRSFYQKLHIDLPLLLGILVLCAYALVILYSASGQNMHYVQKQMIHFVIGFIVMITLAHIPPRHFAQWAPVLYTVGLLLVYLVLVTGTVSKGAQRWLDLRLIKFQPSEVMKLAVPLMLARFLDQKLLPIGWKDMAISGLIILVPAIPIILQPDLGTGLLIIACGLSVIFFAGIPFRFIFLMTGLFVASCPVFWFLLQDYQKSRILMLLAPERDPLGRGYHIIQSKIAIGSGGITGKGWLQGTQAQLDYLPERTTDFIFGVLSEEFGLIGILILMAIYLAIVSRGLYIGTSSQDTFSRLLAGSLTLTFFVYVFINIGMVSGILPVVGVPLPLVSYGGTSMVTLMTSFGILMSIHTHRKLLGK